VVIAPSIPPVELQSLDVCNFGEFIRDNLTGTALEAALGLEILCARQKHAKIED
jgi:hypothetical protein